MQAQLDISKNLLPKIPQFWEAPGTAFAELVQNAVRAGATEIHLTMDDEAGTLTIRDNGRGIHSLDDFLTLGDSQWENEVVEPAGMGFYAHFGYSQRTLVVSRGLRYTFTPACLRGAAVEIHNCEKSSWTVITIEGIESRVLKDIDFTRMRPLPPPKQEIAFTINGAYIPNLLANMTPLDTPVGTVYLCRTGVANLIPRGVWEGLPVGFTYSKHQNLYGSQKDFVWCVDPASGVRPRLPGREGFIQDWAFDEAQAVLKKTIAAYCQQRAAGLELALLPESLDWREQSLNQALEKEGITELVVIAWVKDHLYHKAEVFEGVWIPNEYGFPDYPETSWGYVRKDKVIHFHADTTGLDREGLAVLLNSQAAGWAGWHVRPGEEPETVAFALQPEGSSGEQGAEVYLSNLRWQGSGYLAEALLIGEQVVLQENGLFYHAGVPVWIGNPEDILEQADDRLDLWAFLEYHLEDGNYGDLVGPHNEFDEALLQRHLAERYDLGEDINLHNWLWQVRVQMTGWNGLPQKYLPLFQTALAWAERLALAGVEQAVPALTLTPDEVIEMGQTSRPTPEELAEIARRVGENYRERLLSIDLPLIAAQVIENREEVFEEEGRA